MSVNYLKILKHHLTTRLSKCIKLTFDLHENNVDYWRPDYFLLLVFTENNDLTELRVLHYGSDWRRDWL